MFSFFFCPLLYLPRYHFSMWNGKKKAVTFSFDDGVTQDLRVIEILNRYGLKATFNLNSGSFGRKGSFEPYPGKIVIRDHFQEEDVAKIYAGHEIASHTKNHSNLTLLSEEEIVEQVETDRLNLERISGQKVVGFAYPCGGINNDDRVAEIIARRTVIRYARTTTSTHDYVKQDNLYRFNPTLYWCEEEDVFNGVVDAFLKADPTAPMLLYIWGHSYELDYRRIDDKEFDALCRKLAKNDDIYFGTNSEVLLLD